MVTREGVGVGDSGIAGPSDANVPIVQSVGIPEIGRSPAYTTYLANTRVPVLYIQLDPKYPT